MATSPSEYARRAALPRPISTCVMAGSRSPAAVVRCLDGHLDVVRVALGQTGPGDLDELRFLQVGYGLRAAVAHGRAQPAGELARHGGEGAAVGDLALDAFGDQLVFAEDVVLEVPVLRVGLAAFPVAH